jgi:hypothetical protein
VVHHQRGYRPQRDAGEGQIACLPGEVGDPMINGMAAVIWLIGWAKSTWLVSQIRTPSAPDQTVQHHGRSAQHARRNRYAPRSLLRWLGSAQQGAHRTII